LHFKRAMILPIGKLPPDLLSLLIRRASSVDPRLLLGPGIGLDCAVLDFGENLLVLKSDPITFATDEIGWYAVQVNANDIATTGAIPKWFLATLLLPEKRATAALVADIGDQIVQACRELNVTLVGGHTEITSGLDRPILVGTMLGEVPRHALVTPRGAKEGDRVLLTKGVPIEATAILAREFSDKLGQVFSKEEIEEASAFLYNPGLSVLREAQIAVRAGKITAMHDPTEGGLASALWELAEASQTSLSIDMESVPVPPLSARICQFLNLDPMAAIASGALLMTVPVEEVHRVRAAFQAENVVCAEIGRVEPSPVSVWGVTKTGREKLPRPERDEIARLFEG
jgi:hydrogenase expression/formation protein HypE